MTKHSDTERFLQAVFGNDWRTHAIFAHSVAPKGMRHVRDGDWLDATRDCYWSIAAFPPEAATNLGNNALDVRAFVVDDVGTKGPSEDAVRLALGPPTAIVETSAGNYQWSYRLSKPVLKDDWNGLYGGLEALIGHSKPLEARAAQTLMRLPMGVNTKPQNNRFKVRLVSVDASKKLDPAGIARTSGPGPSKASGSGSVKDIRGLLALIPNDDVDYDFWMECLHRTRALAADPDAAWEAIDEWSAKSSKYDPGETARRWATVSPTHTSGKELLAIAAAADPEGYAAWQARESGLAFDDGEVDAAAAVDVLNLDADQEKSSIAVVNWLDGRLKHVGRDDWREFDPSTGRWREWTGNHMLRVVLELVRERKQRALDPEVAKKLGSFRFIEGVARAAALHRSVVAKVTDFDRAPLLLGVPSGVIDLSKGASRAVRRGRASEMISKSMWVDPAPAGSVHPEWSRFLSEFTQGDAALEEWLQVRAGYCLTGLMDEYIMPFYHGSGGNGKSVYLNALRSVWGEYGAQIEHRLLFEKAGGYHLAPLAVLAGVRLAIVTDVPQGASWDVHIMKMLTGDDAITANRMHQNPVTFKSTAKIDVSGNGEPVVKDMDDGIRRRLKLIPLTAKPRVIDKQLSRKLAAEWPAILSWALVGLDMYWGLGGFPVSKTVDDATKDYHNMLDPFQRWQDECLVKDSSKGAKVSTTDLFRSWDTFRSAEGRHGMTPNNASTMTRRLKEKGFDIRLSGGYGYLWGYKTNSINVF